MTNDSKLLNDIVFNYNYAADAVDRALQADHAQQMQAAEKSGCSVSFRNDRINDDFISERAQQSVSIARDDALKAVGKALNEARNIITDAPTTEEANYIVSISQRSDMTHDEIEAAMSRYTGHAAQHAIRSAAIRSGFKDFGIKTDVERRIDMLNQLHEAVERDFSYWNLIGKDDAYRGVVRANYELIIKAKGGEPSAQEFGKMVFGDPYAPLD